MNAVWFGAADSPVNSATRYINIVNVSSSSWQNFENINAFGQACIAISDACTVRKFTVWLATPPGSGNSWTFKIRKNEADSGASVTISDSGTTTTWTGSIPVAQLDLLALSSVPASSPDTATNVYWEIEYDTPGNYYLIPSISDGIQNLTTYHNPFGGNTSASGSSQTATNYEALIPTGLTVTRIAGSFNDAPGSGKSYTFTVRKNNTTDSSFTAVVSDTNIKAVSAEGALAFAAGDKIVVKLSSAGNPLWMNPQTCLTVVPDTVGEIAQGFSSQSTASTSATNYESPLGIGKGINTTWDATESNVCMRVPAATIKKFYVEVGTAPGSGKSRLFTLRSNIGDTAIACAISDTATTGSDTSNVAVHNNGDFVAIKTVPSSTPASTTVKYGYVMVISQTSQANKWFSA